MSIHLRLSIPLTKKTHFRRKEEHKSYRRGLKMLQPFPATTAGQGTCHSADRLHPETGKGKGADGTPAKMDGPGVRVVPASCRRDAHGEVLPFGRLQTDCLFTFQPLEYNRSLYSEEHKKSLSITDVTAQIRIEQDEKGKRFVLRINGKNILYWFREQFEKLLRRIRPTIQQSQQKSSGFKL